MTGRTVDVFVLYNFVVETVELGGFVFRVKSRIYEAVDDLGGCSVVVDGAEVVALRRFFS